MSEKIQKVLARQGLGSRREIERWIADGRISVNRQVAKLGDRITSKDKVTVDGRSVAIASEPEATRVIAYHKPVGEVCTRHDPEGRPIVFDHLPRISGERWVNVGRLDINTSGLLLLTNNGELANALMHPSSQLQREYAVRVFGDVDSEMLYNLTLGVELEDGKARFEEIVESSGKGKNRWFHVVVVEGRNRVVRRLWESQGVTVSRLVRVRYGPVILEKKLLPGEWEEVTGATLTKLLSI